MLLPDETTKVSKGKKLVNDVVHYQRGNETGVCCGKN